ncbi:hypothetical protein R1CP_18245 [Rhodococcus opacus]|uniref:Uncharacterized protein n=1 Tax=Rhodococcus opacus TaxID=37919 RepID=A0A1B1K6S3_RHOOP|nr:hypothetical protein R1CP_18245 [Rhodococcus opacus]
MAMISIRTGYPLRGKATPGSHCAAGRVVEKCSGTTEDANGAASAVLVG